MDSNPLVIEQTDAGAELIRRLRSCLQVEAAFWLNPSEEGGWTLHRLPGDRQEQLRSCLR